MKLPETLHINAYNPGQSGASLSQVQNDSELWALRNKPDTLSFLASQEPADLRDWRDPRVGWGLVVPDNPALNDQDSAELADYAKDPIRDLWEARGSGPVFRYKDRPDWSTLIWSARDKDDILLSASPPGTGMGALPYYILIYGGPDVIPWAFQYVLNQNRKCFVGRLPCTGDQAANYVRAAIDDFRQCPAKKSSAVVWAPVWDEEGEVGITRLMRDVIAQPVYDKLSSDKDKEVDALLLDGLLKEASVGRLLDELAARNPALLVTTSHGQTGPLSSRDAMLASLGVPLDQVKDPLAPETVVKRWNPGGAIWYAHACCSAGSDANTNFGDLLKPKSTADVIVRAVAALGTHVSPLPLKLLQADQPVRAFIGHVEPTFDYSLTYPFKPTSYGVGFPGSIPIVDALPKALYDSLYRKKPEPVGLALRGVFDQIGGIDAGYNQCLKEYNSGKDEEMAPALIWSRLCSNDIKTTVILGDPAVALPT